VANAGTDFLIQAAALDEYIRMDNPSSDPVAVRIITRRLKESADLYQYFFAQRPAAGWARILFDNKFFDDPPGIVQVDEGFRTPFWAPSAYLVEVAELVPEVVRSVVATIKTNNPVIHNDLIRSLAKLNPEISAAYIGVVKSWLDNPFRLRWWGVPEAAATLMTRLSEAGHVHEAIELLSEILQPIGGRATKHDQYILGGEAQSKYELSYFRPDFWQQMIPTLEKTAHRQVINALEHSLRKALQFELDARGENGRLDSWSAHGWRASTSDTSQDTNSDYKDKLFVALRDSITRLVTVDPAAAREIIEAYLPNEAITLRRMAIYTVSEYPAVFLGIALSMLSNAAIHNDITVHNEYFALLRKTYPLLPESDKKRIISIILSGPNRKEAEEQAQWETKQFDTDISANLDHHIKSCIRNRLWVLRDWLDIETQHYLESLLTEGSVPPHPEFLAWSSGVFTISEQSPYSAEELASLEPPELLSILETWSPNAHQEFGPIQITRRGLAKVAATVLLQNAFGFQTLVPNIGKLAPVYISTLFDTAEQAWSKEQAIPWGFLIEISKLIVEQNRIDDSDRDLGSDAETKIAFLRLVASGLGSQHTIPLEYRPDVESVLLALLNDPNPDESDDDPGKGWFGHGDPATVAINTVRPNALICLFEFLRIKVIQAESKTQDGEERISRQDLLTPRIRSAIEFKLNKSSDPSWSVHSVFGHYLGLLHYVDSDWVQQKLPAIFPTEGYANARYFVAAWDSYVIYNHPARDLFTLLHSQYVQAITNLIEGRVTSTHLDPETALLRHLLLDYLSRPYELPLPGNNNLLQLLLSGCTERTRGRAAWVLWQLTKTMDVNERKGYWPAVRAFWQWRTNEASIASRPGEFDQEMEWYARLAQLAPNTESIESLMPLLDALIPYLYKFTIWQTLEEYLATQVERAPVQVIKYYRRMMELAPASEFGPSRHGDETEKIIRTAFKDPSARRDAVAVLDAIGRETQGRDERYRNLYKTLAS
jgi:hypothetical protein